MSKPRKKAPPPIIKTIISFGVIGECFYQFISNELARKKLEKTKRILGRD